MKRLAATILLTLACILGCGAQTTLAVKGDLDRFSDFRSSGHGAEIVFGHQLPFGFLQVGLGGRYFGYAPAAADIPEAEVQQDIPGNEPGQEPVIGSPVPSARYRFLLSASYMPRLWGSRSHSVNLYLGAGAQGGYETYHPETVAEGAPSGGFVAGIFPEAQAEFFLGGHVSLYADIKAPWNFMGSGRKFRPVYGAGVRFLF